MDFTWWQVQWLVGEVTARPIAPVDRLPLEVLYGRVLCQAPVRRDILWIAKERTCMRFQAVELSLRFSIDLLLKSPRKYLEYCLISLMVRLKYRWLAYQQARWCNLTHYYYYCVENRAWTDQYLWKCKQKKVIRHRRYAINSKNNWGWL